jgi:hypothetical protein
MHTSRFQIPRRSFSPDLSGFLMRRNYQPSRPSAMTCCFFSSLKTFTAGG